MSADHTSMAAVPTHPVARAGATPIGVFVSNRFKINAMPAVFTLGLDKVMQPANTTDCLTAYCEQASNLALTFARD